jgi:uncharacterized protein
VRAVLDSNVIVAALISPGGSPARVLRAWIDGAFDLIVSPLLLDELERVLAYPRLRPQITRDEAAGVVDWLRREAVLLPDPDGLPPLRSPDPGDDYLIVLAAQADAFLVTGDSDLLDLSDRIPVMTPARFLDHLDTAG